MVVSVDATVDLRSGRRGDVNKRSTVRYSDFTIEFALV